MQSLNLQYTICTWALGGNRFSGGFLVTFFRKKVTKEKTLINQQLINMKHSINHHSKLILCLFLIITISSCKKFLDIKSNNAQAVPTTLSDLQALLDYSSRMNLLRTPTFSESSCDDYFLLEANYNAFEEDRQRIYTWRRQAYNFQNDWSISYEPVYTANFCLEQLEKNKSTTITALQWNNIKGSALFYRSYYFLGLAWMHAKAYDKQTANTDLGIVLRLVSDFNVPSKRASVEDSYNRIIQDAKEAVTYLPDYPIHVMRPSKTAAYALLARTYLSMRLYDSAYRYADLSLNLKSDLINFNGDADIIGSVTAAIPFKQFNKETIFYTEMSGNTSTVTASRARIDTFLYQSYDNNDLRKKAFFRSSPPYQLFKGSYSGNTSPYFTGITTAEMLLVRAECLARNGEILNAMNDLNTLMQKRWSNSVPYPTITAVDANDALTKVLAERRKELYMRGIRWSDIKRLNKENANIILVRKMNGNTYTLLPNANYYALPIPQDIINLTGIPQNEN